MATILQMILSNAFSSMKMSELQLKFHWSFVPRGPINNTAALVQIMAWRRPGDKPLSEPMVVRLLMHICITWPQWVDKSWWVANFTNKIQALFKDISQNFKHSRAVKVMRVIRQYTFWMQHKLTWLVLISSIMNGQSCRCWCLQLWLS